MSMDGPAQRRGGCDWTPRLRARLMHAVLALPCLLQACALSTPPALTVDELLIVDCLLPGQVRQLGAFSTGITPRRPARIPAHECSAGGGEYALASHDPAGALKLWLPFAQAGDAAAQTQVGELYERGVGGTPDEATAAHWYQRAARQGDPRAMVDLGALFERGAGVGRDPAQAERWFRQASGLAALTPGPSVHIIEPLTVLPTRAAEAPPLLTIKPGLRQIVLRVRAESGWRSVKLDGLETRPDEQGLIRLPVAPADDGQIRNVEVVDRQGRRAELRFVLALGGAKAQEATAPGNGRSERVAARLAGRGEAHALIIANEDYASWQALDTPLRDAQALRQLLQSRYGFKVTLLSNATRRDVFAAFAALRDSLGAQDRLLVYYAGHGEVDPVTRQGYWIPVDGERRLRSQWVSVSDVTDQLGAMAARQVLVIADSCYSGTMTRAALPGVGPGLDAAAREHALDAATGVRARVALTSGGVEPVVDGGAGRHSLFARSLLDVLGALPEPTEARRVHHELLARFTWRAQALGVRQQPDYAPIRFAGHEAGDFVFVPRRR